MGFSSSPLQELDQRIVALVQQSWQEHQMPLLLSRLGAQDGGEVARLAKQESFSLAAYLRDRLAGDVRVIQHSTKPVVVGAVPADVDGEPGDLDALLERTHGQSVRAPPRFHPAFWAAFRVPLDEDKRRYMSVVPPLRFVDVYPEDRPEGDDHAEVEREYVDSELEPSQVQQNVDDWLEANGLEAMPFLASPEGTHGQSAGAPPRFHPAFWAAFRVPLDEDKSRYMSVVPPLRFVDAYAEDRPDGDDYAEVEWEYIDSDVETSEVQRNVDEWLEANGLEATPFLASNRPSAPRAAPEDLLGRLLAALDVDDQKRVSLPLDIVAKLRRS